MYLEKSNDLPSIRHELPVVLALLHIIISTEPSGYKSPGSTSGPGFDSPWERISQDFNGVCAFGGRRRSRRQRGACVWWLRQS
jgi:hypothetical protein